MSETKEYTLDEVSKHTKTEDCWLVIGNGTNGERLDREFGISPQLEMPQIMV
jgi:hypothetical protein